MANQTNIFSNLVSCLPEKTKSPLGIYTYQVSEPDQILENHICVDPSYTQI